jgi:hypothetical protein
MSLVLDIPLFRKSFPEFQDVNKYPTPMITLWATFAEQQLNQCTWKSTWSMAVQLYVAHEITLEAQSAAAATTGGTPGSQGGIAASKTVGSVSVSYDSANTAEKGAGYWNLTTYGKQFYRLSRMFGAGAIQL